MVYHTSSEEETKKIARELAMEALPGSTYLLIGDLGSGKTTFTKGFAKGLGITEEINSPTFTIAKEYKVKSPINKLIHIDCYRLNSLDEAKEAGIIDYIEQKDSIKIIEWPEILIKALPESVTRITIELEAPNDRKITIR